MRDMRDMNLTKNRDMKKKEFKAKLIYELDHSNTWKSSMSDEVNIVAVDSALNKLAVWMKNAYGGIDWQEAYDETYNQASAKQRRK